MKLALDPHSSREPMEDLPASFEKLELVTSCATVRCRLRATLTQRLVLRGIKVDESVLHLL